MYVNLKFQLHMIYSLDHCLPVSVHATCVDISAADTYDVYIWTFGSDRPELPATTTQSLTYRPTEPLPDNTRILWQIIYSSIDNLQGIPTETTRVPGPVWGFITRPYPDLAVTEVTVPGSAFSGASFAVQYTVENIGNANTALQNSAGNVVRFWLDYIYIDTTPSFDAARLVARVWQTRSLDAMDGYQQEVTISLEDADIGQFYVRVMTDVGSRVSLLSIDVVSCIEYASMNKNTLE